MMDFIATYWWAWLTGELGVLALLAFRSIANTIGLVRDVVTISHKLLIALRFPAGQRRQKLAEVGIEVAWNKIKARAIDYVVLGTLALAAAGFGLLLILAILHRRSA